MIIKTIHTINMNFLEEFGMADYSNGDIIIMADTKALPHNDSPFQIDMMLIMACTKGSIRFDINGATYTARKGDIAIFSPKTLITSLKGTDDFSYRIIGLSYNAIQHSLIANKKIWNLMKYVTENPIVHLSLSKQVMAERYYSLLTYKMKQRETKYHKEMMNALHLYIFYEIYEVMEPLIEKNTPKKEILRQGDFLFKRFIELLTMSKGKERSVNRYAEQLCVTPKYLSAVSKRTSGKTALEWIHKYTIGEITQQLKYTDKTIKEISDGLEFPNLSFFGKFVKSHLGMSPTEFRKQDNLKERF
ncbi:helix-turn-helix domain-containing protein [Xylanibacter muris]|uniref:AraC family transcriptional regulator n=1 Tax=Xylanibacter muris TaxID=2736290 RepID=A0ABX2AIP1_9BACT|nr:helix-turn-helix domain-containing protein [Xylanibacter muris]NPD90789.1 AraC family transcriptional regulator [Xylanibacter muris]